MNGNNADANKPQKTPTQRLVYAGVLTALSCVFIILTNFLPLRFSLLMAAAACYYIAFDKCGVMYAVLTIIASVLISFFTRPFSSAFFLTVIAFAPYSAAAYFLKKFSYFKMKGALIRIGVMTAFSALVFLGVFLAAKFIDFDILGFIERLSYVGFIAVFIILVIIFDAAFSVFIARAVKLLK